jgi:hypothetical protein
MGHVEQMTDKYRRSMELRGCDRASIAAAAGNYGAGVFGYQEYMRQVTFNLDHDLPLPMYARMRMMQLCQRVYAVVRTTPRGELIDRLGRECRFWVDPQTSAERVYKTVMCAFRTLHVSVLTENEERLRLMIAGKWEGREPVMAEEQRAAAGSDAEAKVEAVPQTVTVATEAVKERLAEYLKSRVEDPGMADAMAADLAAVVAQADKPKRGRPKRTRPGAGADELSRESVLAESTPVEKGRRKHAAQALRQALSEQQPVVKLVVTARLCEHKSYDDLAKEFGLSREDVTFILSKLRGWVCRFTDYFTDDWHWVETGQKFLLAGHMAKQV